MDQLLLRLGYRDRKPNDRTLASCREAMDIGHSLVEPRSVHMVVDVEGVEGDTVRLEGGATLQGAHLAKLLGCAEQAVLTCNTIGPAVERKAETLLRDDAVTSYALDVYGSIAVSQLGRAMRQALVKALTGAAATGVTVSMAPGQLDWSVRDQSVFFSILHPEAIGVTLTSSSMMRPRKSTTSAFAVGDPARVELGRPACDHCPKQATCAFHHESQGEGEHLADVHP
jgi:hypothetical protein